MNPANRKSDILRSLVKLPPMPMVILKARETMADPNAGLRDLARIVENDPALVAKVLALANSAYYGTGGQVSSLQHAAVLLGLDTLGQVITVAAGAALLCRELKGYGIGALSIWRHSLSTALCARRIAEKRFAGAENDAFLAGLLHDTGKVILDPFMPERTAAPGRNEIQAPPASLEAEKEALGFDHAEIMARACRFWRFPETYETAIRFHHRPSESSQSALAHIVHLGDFLSHRAGFGHRGAMPAGGLEAQTLAFLQVPETELGELQAALSADVAKLEGELRPG